MSKRHVDVTGRDGYIISQALAYAIEAIERSPKPHEISNQQDMIKLLNHRSPRHAQLFRDDAARKLDGSAPESNP